MATIEDQWSDFTFEEEFLASGRKKSYGEGMEGLMMAVLQDGVDCFQKYLGARTAREKRLFQEAEDWILDEESDAPFSFESLCEVLGLDARFLRDGLLRWKDSALREAQNPGVNSRPRPADRPPREARI